MKANANLNDQTGNYPKGWNARRSLNLLKFSLSRPTTLPYVEDDSDEEMEIVEQDEKLAMQLLGMERIAVDARQPDQVQKSSQHGVFEKVICGETVYQASMSRGEVDSPDTDVNMEVVFEPTVSQDSKNNSEILMAMEDQHECREGNGSAPREQTTEAIPFSSIKIFPNEEVSSKPVEEISVKAFSLGSKEETSLHSSAMCFEDGTASMDINITPCNEPLVLKSPTPSVSPRVNSSSRKSLRTSSILTASQKDLAESKLALEEAPCLPLAKPSNSICLNLSSKRSKSCFRPTEHLAASLQRGLEILDNHRQSTSLRKSSFRFSYKPADSKALLPINKVDIGVQTHFHHDECAEGDPMLFLCTRCKMNNFQEEYKNIQDSSNLQLVPVDGGQACDKFKAQVPKVYFMMM